MSKPRETFVGYVVHSTGKSVLFEDHYWDQPDWFPLSQVEFVTQEGTHEVSMLASDWICSRKSVKEESYE